MLKKIESLRKKPKSVRNRYAFSIALFITGIIALVWATTLPSRLTPHEDPELVASAQEDASHFSKAFEEVFAQAREVFSNVQKLRYEKEKPGVETIDLTALVASSSEGALEQEVATTTASTSLELQATTTATATEPIQ